MTALLLILTELATYGFIGVVGWRIHPLVGVGAVVFMALWWGLFHSPKAPVHLPAWGDAVGKMVWFLVPVVCLIRLVATG